jgi:hypothetical protein
MNSKFLIKIVASSFFFLAINGWIWQKSLHIPSKLELKWMKLDYL